MSAARTDRELLELAAKAAGGIASDGLGECFDYERDAMWNPLTDDGDNRRLQVKLSLGLVPVEGGGWDCISHTADGFEVLLASEFEPNRAVVKAAAEIGASL